MGIKKFSAAIILVVFVFIGCLISYHKAPFAFGSGDHTLFHAFGHWIANGEVFTRDFIHFRTPGPYYYYGLMQYIFGQTFLVTSTSLLMESHVFQMIAGYILTLVFSRSILGKASLSLAAAVGIFFLVAPPIYQLRTALPAASLAMYILSKTTEAPLMRSFQIFSSGSLLGLSFWFGQELFIFLSISIFVGEFSAENSISLKDKILRILSIGGSSLLVIIAGVIYFYLKGVDIGEFFYNTLYYAFLIQPKGMDMPFPALDKSSLIYYIWIAYFVISIVIFSLSKKLYTPTGIVFTAYASLRLISMFGRVDVLHLLFSISEVVIMGVVALRLIPSSFKNITKGTITNTVIIFIITVIILYFAVNGRSSTLLILPFFLLAMSYINKKNNLNDVNSGRFNPLFSITGLCIAILSLYPLSTNAIKFSYNVLFIKPHNTFLGVQLPGPTRKEFQEIKDIIDTQKPKNIFSYPIRAEYYALTNSHATRFIEFAMQTTPDDINGAIEDLKRSKPEIVIQDLDQTTNLSPILSKISNYISLNYTPIKIIQGVNNLEIYKLKPVPDGKIRLFDNVYILNLDHTYTTAGLRTESNGNIVPVIASNKGESRFEISTGVRAVYVQIYPEPNGAKVGIVKIRKGQHSYRRDVSLADGRVKIDLASGNEKSEILLSSGEKDKSVLWLNPEVEVVDNSK